jgi:hypothetical protein
MCETPIHSGVAKVRTDWSIRIFTIYILDGVQRIGLHVPLSGMSTDYSPVSKLIGKQHGLSPAGRGYSLFREVLLNLRQSIETTLGCVRAPPKIRVLDRIAAGG